MTARKKNNIELSKFFRDEYNALGGYVRSRIQDTTDRDAEDIIQEVALRLFSRADDISPIQNVAGYVYHALRNRIIDVMRTRKPVTAEQDPIEQSLGELAGAIYDDSEASYSPALRRRLGYAIRELKPIYREVVLAVDFEGYTYREISEQTGISMGTLMSRRHRALSLLFDKLKTDITET
jgi:RNA polymerase sigma-70 factor (ECF subfamily)